MPKGGKREGSGRKPGVPNKATADARRAIADFVDCNAHRLQGWLDRIADGERAPETKDDDGNKIPGAYIIPPDPKKAFELFQGVIEYHVPKLARMELPGKDGTDIGDVLKTIAERLPV
jgi:hypothetical protein